MFKQGTVPFIGDYIDVAPSPAFVVTAGGEHGIIASVKDTTVMLRVADNVRIEYDRTAIAIVKKAADKLEETTDKA